MSPPLPPPFAGPPSPHPVFPGDSSGSGELRRLRQSGAGFSGLGGSPAGLVTLHREKPAAAEPAPPGEEPKSEAENLQFGSLCGKPESGLSRKVDRSHGWFYF